MPADDAIREYIRAHQEAETRFLAEIVKIPSDNPPGDCDPSAETVATLLEGLGFVGRAAQGSGRPRQGQRHDQRDQPDRPQDLRAGRADDRAERSRRRRAAGSRLDPRPLRRRNRRRLDGRARRRGVEVGHRDLRLRDAGAGQERRGAERNGRTARHLRRGGRRRDRPALDSRTGPVEAGPRDRRGLLLCGRHRPQRLPASRGRGSRPLRARRPALHRRRRARGGQRDSDRALRLARRPRGADVQGSRHRLAADDGRTYFRRHQHQRGAGPDRVPARPPHRPGRESGRGRGGVARGDRASRGDCIPRPRSRSTASCSPSR